MTTLGSSDSLTLPQKFNNGNYSFLYGVDGVTEIKPSVEMGCSKPDPIYDEFGCILVDVMIDEMEREDYIIDDDYLPYA